MSVLMTLTSSTTLPADLPHCDPTILILLPVHDLPLCHRSKLTKCLSKKCMRRIMYTQ
jgi:hypothetical protein